MHSPLIHQTDHGRPFICPAVGDADAVTDATQGLGLHRGLGFASAPDLESQLPPPSPHGLAALAFTPAGFASGELANDTCGAAMHTSGAELLERGSSMSGSSPAGSAAAPSGGAEADAGMTPDPNEAAYGASDGSGGAAAPILYDVAFTAGLGRGGLGGRSSSGSGFSNGGLGFGVAAAEKEAAAVPNAAAPAHRAWQRPWLGLAEPGAAAAAAAALAAEDAAADAEADVGAGSGTLPPPPQHMTPPAAFAAEAGASMRWFDGASDAAEDSHGAARQAEAEDAAAAPDGSAAAQLRDMSRAAAERRNIGTSQPMELAAAAAAGTPEAGGRRPAIGLMTPNETAAQVGCTQDFICVVHLVVGRRCCAL